MQDNVTMEIERLVTDMLQGTHTCIPGKIERFDADKCLAVVNPIGQFKDPDGKLIDYPQVNDVPVVLMQCCGQDLIIAYPIEKDDGCLLFFSEQQLDKFRDDEDAKVDLRFDITNAIALVGLFKDANEVMKEAEDDRAYIIDNKRDSRMTIKEDEQEYKVTDDSTITIKQDQQEYRVTDGSTITIKQNEQECKVGSATITIKDGEITVKAQRIKLDGDVTITGTTTMQKDVTAQQKIEASGEIKSQVDVKTSAVSLQTHTHNCTAPGSPSGPPLPDA